VKPYVPERNDVVWLDFDPQVGHEQAGRRPALVLSPRPYNARTGLFLACPITSRVKGYPFEVLIPEGLEVSGAVLSNQIQCADWRGRRAALVCTLPPEVAEDVTDQLLALLPA
jgi:mRNA interferase MazF